MNKNTNGFIGFIPLFIGILGVLGSFSSALNREVFSLRILFFIFLTVSSLFLYWKVIENREKSLEYILFISIISLAFLFHLYFSFRVVMSISTLDLSLESNNFIFLGNIKRGALFAFPHILISSFYYLTELFKNKLLRFKVENNKEFKFLFLSLLLIIGNIIIYSPLTVLTSSTGTFTISIGKTVAYYLLIAMVAIGLLMGLYKVFSNHRRFLFLLIVVICSIAAWGYTYLLPGDFGNLDGTVLTEANKLNLSKAKVLFEILSLIAVAALLLLLFVKKFNIIFAVVVILNLMSFAQTVSNTVSYLSKSTDLTKGIDNNELNERIFSFSSDENVVVLMLDMFCGGFMPEILEQAPELKSDLEGFTWFPNTLSIANNTFTSTPSIMAGYEYTPDNMNKRGQKLSEQYEDIYMAYNEKFKPVEWDVSVGGLYYYTEKEKFEKNGINYYLNKDLYSYWKNKPENRKKINQLLSPNEYRNIFMAIGLFKASPFMLKSTIYYDSRWLNTNQGGMAIDHILENKALFELLPKESNVNSPVKTFKYFSNDLTHSPWGLDENGELRKDYIVNTPEQIQVKGGNYVNPELARNTFTETLKKLVKWFEWMKEEGIYDNTKIVIVSDHGISGLSPMFGDFMHVEDLNGNPLFPTGRIHPIMLVKDFNCTGDLEISDKLLSNSDTYNIATSHLGGYDPIIDSREREVKLYTTPWKISDNNEDSFTITGEYSVKESIFKKSNW